MSDATDRPMVSEVDPEDVGAGEGGRVTGSMSTSAANAFVVMLSTFGSRILGFIKMAVIGAVFGAGGRADVLHLVLTIPNNLRKLLAEGALSSAFVPVLSDRIVHDRSGEEPRRIVRSLLSFQYLILIPLILLSIVFAPTVIRILLDFPEPERHALAVELFRYVIGYLLLISISAVFVGTLNSHERFFIPALAPIMFSVAVIGSILFFHQYLGIFSMAVGVLVGGVLQVVLQIPLVRRMGYDFRPELRFSDPNFRRVLRQWVPVVATAGIYTVNHQVAMRFASGLEPGSGSAMSNALVFWQLPFGLFSASITTVMFPRISRQLSASQRSQAMESAETGFRYLIALLIPSSVVLGVYGEEIIAMALQRGAFTVENTRLAARVLTGFSFGLLGVGAFTYFQRVFYADGDYRVPLRVGLFVLCLDVALSLWLKETHLRVVGLSVANSVAFTTGLLILLYQVSRRFRRFDVKALGRSFAHATGAALALFVYLRVVQQFLGDFWVEGSTVLYFGVVVAVCIVGGAIVLLYYWFLRAEIVTVFLAGRLKRPGKSRPGGPAGA